MIELNFEIEGKIFKIFTITYLQKRFRIHKTAYLNNSDTVYLFVFSFLGFVAYVQNISTLGLVS